MKFNLEEILRNTLIDKQNDAVEKSESGSIAELITGEYLDEEKLVFLHEMIYDLPLKTGKCILNSLEISDVIYSWVEHDKGSSESFIFLDTETTGLSSGAGTWIFLTGLGFFCENKFIIKQYFMTDPAGEDLYMEKLAEEIERFRYIVSFNGRSYDVNLLKNRFIMNGVNPNILKLPNIDLLFLSRRLWKNLLDNCKLQTLEENILGISRKHADDIDSREIPQKYFDYLKDGNAFYMEKIFNHNLQDILSMPILLNEISKRIDKYWEEGIDFRLRGIAGLYIEQKKWEQAEKCLKAGMSGDESLYCKLNLAKILKRKKEYQAAIKIWESENVTECCEELAKYYEHECKDYEKALEYTERGIDLIYGVKKISGKKIADWYKRRLRLEKKLGMDEKA